jgi:5'(3')-deoxyribonucleotidase
MMARLLFDVDQTVTDPSELWWEWLECMTCTDKEMPLPLAGEKISYDLSDYFMAELEMCGVDPMDFWRGTNVYDFARPLEFSVEAIWDLKDAGHKIMFASHCKGHHMRSKYRFLERWFPVDSFHATKEKCDIKCDLVVDDRVSFLNTFDDSVHKILFASPYTQDEIPKGLITPVEDWVDTLYTINKLLAVN